MSHRACMFLGAALLWLWRVRRGYEITDIDRSIEAGLSLDGPAWRPWDYSIGVALS